MKKLIKTTYYFGICLCTCMAMTAGNVYAKTESNKQITSVDSKRQQQLTQQAKQKIKTFATELKGELVGAIKEKGLSHAVGVCKDKAPQIAASLSKDGWTVARTSLKTRNTNNQPDKWETQTLESFDSEYKSDKQAGMLTATLLNDEAFRFMKAIPTGQVCLACHGQKVDKALMQTIKADYPQDMATGFTLKDIRGAFTVTKDLSE